MGQAPAEPPTPKREALGWWHNDRQREPSVYSALGALVDQAGTVLTHALAREWLVARWQLQQLYRREERIRAKVGSSVPRVRPDNERRFLQAFSALPRVVIVGRKGGRQHRLSDGRSAGDVWRREGWGTAMVPERSPTQRVVRILTFLVSHQQLILDPRVVATMTVVERYGVESAPAMAAGCPDVETFLDRFVAAFLQALVRNPNPEDCAVSVSQWLLAQPETIDLYMTDMALAGLLRELSA
jgi:hypothetical protein